MSEQQFQPGDRVHVGPIAAGFVGDPPIEFDGIVSEIGPATNLLIGERHIPLAWAGFVKVTARPIYPEPGQVVVALDAEFGDSFDLYETNDAWAPGGSDHHYFVLYGTDKAAELPVEIFEVLRSVVDAVDRAREAAR